MTPAIGTATAQRRIAIVGGGWAGCAAAVTLADRGTAVTLIEQAAVLGGRARRVERAGLALDNGQHLLLGAYRETLRLIARVQGHAPPTALLARLPLALRPFGRQPLAVDLRAWHAPAPFHLLAAMIAARGLEWSARRALMSRLVALRRQRFAVPALQDVTTCFAGVPRPAFDAIIAPLCIAALNTLPGDASAQVFARVLRDAFFGGRAMSDFLLPATDLSALFPEAAGRHIAAAGGQVRTGASVRDLCPADGRIVLKLAGVTSSYDAVILAVGPHQLASTLDPATARMPSFAPILSTTAAFRYEPITTVYLAFASPVPMSSRIQRLDDAPGQWVFDRSPLLPPADGGAGQALLAVVISAHGPHEGLDHAALTERVVAQLRRLAPDLPPLAWSQVIAERRATYACTPGLARPAAGRIAPGLYLAGDYTDLDLPATLEAAVRSGVRAAECLLADLAPNAPPR